MFATILERVFFKTTPPILSVIGAILILASALYVAVRFLLPYEIRGNYLFIFYLFQLTKTAAKTTPKPSKVDSVIDQDLEEGLLEQSSLESSSESTVRPYSRESLEAEETSALAPEDPTRPLT